MPKTEVLSLFLIKTWDTALSARQAGVQTFLRHVSSEADSEDCPGVSMGHANPLSLSFLKIWFSLRERVFLERRGSGGGGRAGWGRRQRNKRKAAS